MLDQVPPPGVLVKDDVEPAQRMPVPVILLGTAFTVTTVVLRQPVDNV